MQTAHLSLSELLIGGHLVVIGRLFTAERLLMVIDGYSTAIRRLFDGYLTVMDGFLAVI